MRKATGGMEGVEAVIDKDRTAALLAMELQADVLLMLTDVAAIFADWGQPSQRALDDITPEALEAFSFDAGSMGPKVASACSFVRAGGTMAGVGRLTDARAIVEGRAGTRISDTSAPNLPL
jgi:carbamate kinase